MFTFANQVHVDLTVQMRPPRKSKPNIDRVAGLSAHPLANCQQNETKESKNFDFDSGELLQGPRHSINDAKHGSGPCQRHHKVVQVRAGDQVCVVVQLCVFVFSMPKRNT